jgi:hypothetical protein
MAPDGLGLGAVEFLPDPAEQMGFHLLQLPHSLLASALIDQ